VYRARDQVENEAWIDDLEQMCERLEFSAATRSRAIDLFLSNVPDSERSKRAVAATSLYVAGLTTGDARSQTEIAAVADVTRLTISNRWKAMLESAGLDAPTW